ncbi:MAG: hypothetical protein HUU28_12755, partial [Planctomycetaceae bacterium]|nr:hypothetical protein [Planctomycetaceae bacterium]
KAVVGGSRYADRLELDRDFGQAEMKAAGMTTLPSWDFDSFDAALAFVKANPGRYVVKPNGEAQNEKVLSDVGQDDDGEDVVHMLEFFRRGWSGKLLGFQVQKHATGVEVAVGAFFNGKRFLLPACVNFEHKKLFDGEIGPSTGEMGTSMFWTEANALVRETILRFEAPLARSGYTGYFDLNCIASSRGIVPLEATCRFGYPTIDIQLDGVLSPWSDFLAAQARGEPRDGLAGELGPDALLDHALVVDVRVVEAPLQLVAQSRDQVPEAPGGVLLRVQALFGLEQLVGAAHLDVHAVEVATREVGQRERGVHEHALVPLALILLDAFVDDERARLLAQLGETEHRALLQLAHGLDRGVEAHLRVLPAAVDQVDRAALGPAQERRVDHLRVGERRPRLVEAPRLEVRHRRRCPVDEADAARAQEGEQAVEDAGTGGHGTAGPDRPRKGQDRCRRRWQLGCQARERAPGGLGAPPAPLGGDACPL